jgi:hypothetical protein
MSEPSQSPVRYRVAYSERIRTELRGLIARAASRGLGRQVVAAVQALDERLHIYPQFGEPLRDMELKPAQLWIGCVALLVVRYWLNEELRTVIVVGAVLLLPRPTQAP